jgi:uncharacterized LabA/DUF88 family protein
MDLIGLKAEYYFFKKVDFGRVYVFVDFGNVRPWAKELWPDENKYRISREIDISKLAEIIGWIFPVKKFFYYGRYVEHPSLPREHQENKRYRNSIFRLKKAKKSGFQVVDKEIKMIPHYDDSGKFIKKIPKCNFDVEITMDMLIKAEKYDTVMLFSGDSDFGGLLNYLKSKGKKVVVVCTRNRMSTELQKVANVFVPAETLANFIVLNPEIKKHSACAEV